MYVLCHVIHNSCCITSLSKMLRRMVITPMIVSIHVNGDSAVKRKEENIKSDYPYISYYFEHIWCIFGITVLKFNNFIVQYYVVPIQESQRSLVSNLPFYDFGIWFWNCTNGVVYFVFHIICSTYIMHHVYAKCGGFFSLQHWP